MPETRLPLVDAGDIIKLVGPASFQRAQAYVRHDAVQSFRWDPDSRTLTGVVQGNRPDPYDCGVELAASEDRPLSSWCSCPMYEDCKHVAAILLSANSQRIASEQSQLAEQQADEPEWKTVLFSPAPRTQLRRKGTGAPVTDTAPEAESEPLHPPMALQFELQPREEPSRQRWRPPGHGRGLPSSTASGRYRLGVRPVVRGGKNNWVKAGLNWNNIAHRMNQMNLDPEQHRWFRQFAPLHRASGEVYYGYDADWLYLDDFSSPLLWHLFGEARKLGIELVGSRKAVTVTVGSHADVSLDATRRPFADERDQLSTDAADAGSDDAGTGDAGTDTDGAGTDDADSDLQLAARLTIDGVDYSTELAGIIGNHGIYTGTADNAIVLAPTGGRLSHEQMVTVQREAPLIVPSGDVREFLDKFYPRLRRAIRITSSDASVTLPEIAPPTLLLTVTFAPKHTLHLQWEWEYGGPGAARYPAGPDATGVTDVSDLRDLGAETLIRQRLDEALSSAAPQSVFPVGALESTTLQGLPAAEFAVHALPVIREVSGVRVLTEGEEVDYRELTDIPQLTISTVETDQRDWFDLGVLVQVSGKTIPFGPIFAALAKGAKKLLLIDGTYLSLEQPVFDRLKQLIHEARSLSEWETGVRISRYQASLYDDFEDLADETVEAEAWRDVVRGLRDIQSIEPAPTPQGLNAELRPYQRDGFNWLAFLWDKKLGGVLADDMGLGKTLQALAMIAHARQRDPGPTGTPARSGSLRPVGEPKPPFLVVAPTSVVSNWVVEAQRFVPHLTVHSITDTELKSGKPLARLAEGADILITSYTLFRLDFAAYQRQEWAGLILDEAQFVKNHKAQGHQCARDLDVPFKLAITGTPMENNLMELWALFAIVAPGLFPSPGRFREGYQRPIEAGNVEVLDRLRRRIRPLMMRRTKELVARELPAKQEQVLEVELTTRHRKVYDTFLQRERQKLLGLLDDLDSNRFIVFRSLTLLRMLSLDASLVDEKYDEVPSSKLDALFEQLEDVVAEGHRCLIFSQFTSFLRKAAERLDEQGVDYCYLDGSTRGRAKVIDAFKKGDAPVFLISLKAGGFGLNLTEADYVFLLDPWWNPASESQAVDRTHRIGQTKSVMVYRMVARGTIEEKVMALKERKAKLFNSVMDDDAAFSTALSADDIRSLLDA